MQSHVFSIKELASDARALVNGEPNLIANLSNLSSLLFHAIGNLNWCGFYLVDSGAAKKELVLGPFQGKPACLRIAFGKGICGTAWAEAKAMNVPDVHAVKNHIACDAATRSELVIPLVYNGLFRGVLDLDSETLGRFDKELEAQLAHIAREVIEPLWNT